MARPYSDKADALQEEIAHCLKAEQALTDWLNEFGFLGIGYKHVQSARRQVRRELEALQEEAGKA